MSKQNLDSTYETLFALLRNVLTDAPQQGEVQDFAALLHEARRQTVDGLLYALPQLAVRAEERPLLMRWIGGLPQLEQANRRMNQAVVALARAFDKEQIRYVLLKGQSCAAVYPQPLLRRPGDIDLYVAPQHFERAKSLLLQQGFAPDHSTILHDTFEKDGLEVELHRALQPLQWPPAAKRLQQMMHEEVDTVDEWQDFVVIDDYNVPILPPHLNVILLTAHVLTHASHRGVGLRQLMDWAVVMRNYQKQWKVASQRDHTLQLETALSHLHLTRFYRLLAAFSAQYLGIAVAATNERDQHRAAQLLRWVIATGNHGHHSATSSRHSGFFARVWVYFSNMFRHFSWAPTEYLGIPWYMLRRVTHKLC